jgi:lactoylglutathione lyase
VWDSLQAMSDSSQNPTTVTNIGVAMFTVADQDAALEFYTQKLGFEVRSDMRFGENGEMRWLEVAPAGSTARLALNPPMSGQPGGGSIGVETPDAQAEHERLKTVEGVDVDDDIMQAPGVPTMFSVRDPDGNNVWIVETPPES